MSKKKAPLCGRKVVLLAVGFLIGFSLIQAILAKAHQFLKFVHFAVEMLIGVVYKFINDRIVNNQLVFLSLSSNSGINLCKGRKKFRYDDRDIDIPYIRSLCLQLFQNRGIPYHWLLLPVILESFIILMKID